MSYPILCPKIGPNPYLETESKQIGDQGLIYGFVIVQFFQSQEEIISYG